jgi:hypothetical protein
MHLSSCPFSCKFKWNMQIERSPVNQRTILGRTNNSENKQSIYVRKMNTWSESTFILSMFIYVNKLYQCIKLEIDIILLVFTDLQKYTSEMH